ncbi:hypothetical protein C8C94_0769 [Acidovorax sp. 94]|uniref:hypothetical protein n=1 Tax=Acidovorax sp. 94 TaxID=2135633 RepID=UPI000F192006|nr:hypothetical protein [Acidovorax sp. 94]RKR66313.1 hypothetical protein C8C94_0769 [Acidovorax sp. 94]
MTRAELTDEQIEARMPKKAGRPAMTAAQPVAVVLNGEAAAQAVADVDGLAQLQVGYNEERDLANQLLGQAQMADSFAKFSLTVSVSKLAFVRENKLYKAFKGKKSADGQRFLSGTWDEYCDLLGRSRQQVDEEISNLKSFGEQALESMSAMGIGYRELRQYRKLPEDQKQALIEVAKAGDKEGFVELAEEIIAKHAKEKEALAAQVEEAQATLEAKDRVLQTRAELIGKLEEQVAGKFKPLPGSEARTAQEQALLKELDEGTSSAFLSMHRTFKAADAALSGSGARDAIQARARQAVEFLAQQLADMCEEFGISVDLDERINPSWLSEDAIAAIEARNAANPHTNTRAQ